MLDNNSKYDVGYAKPPKGSQFQPGKSGNPNGRPKGSKNSLMTRDSQSRVMDIIIEQAETKITVNEGGRRVKISALEAIIKAINVNAIKGKIGAQRLAVEMVAKAATTKQQQTNEQLRALIEFKYLMTPVYEEREKAEAEGYNVGPPPTPIHPKDILIDEETCEVTILHPKSREWIETDREFTVARDDQLKEISLFKEMLETETNPKRRAMYLNDIERAEEVIAIYEQIIPKPGQSN